jgi:tyrosyl-tRNA synthetase
MVSQKGVSFTEFTYQLLQAYDFFWLHKNMTCSIQVGGSDQWGNILAGLEMINRENLEPLPRPKLVEEKGFGLTTPLLTTASGQKFGKSDGNAIWLNEQMTSAFDFYQVYRLIRESLFEMLN